MEYYVNLVFCDKNIFYGLFIFITTIQKVKYESMSTKVFLSKLKLFYKSNLSFSVLSIIFITAFALSPYLINIKTIYGCAAAAWSFIVSLSKGHIIPLFFLVFAVELISILFIYLSGLSLSGFAVAYFFVFVIGAFCGIFSGYCYSELGYNGFIYCVVNMYPSVLVFSIALLFASREAFVFSKMIGKAFSPINKYNFYNDFKLYSIRFLIFVCVIVVSALLYAITIKYIRLI